MTIIIQVGPRARKLWFSRTCYLALLFSKGLSTCGTDRLGIAGAVRLSRGRDRSGRAVPWPNVRLRRQCLWRYNATARAGHAPFQPVSGSRSDERRALTRHGASTKNTRRQEQGAKSRFDQTSERTGTPHSPLLQRSWLCIAEMQRSHFGENSRSVLLMSSFIFLLELQIGGLQVGTETETAEQRCNHFLTVYSYGF